MSNQLPDRLLGCGNCCLNCCLSQSSWNSSGSHRRRLFLRLISRRSSVKRPAWHRASTRSRCQIGRTICTRKRHYRRICRLWKTWMAHIVVDVIHLFTQWIQHPLFTEDDTIICWQINSCWPIWAEHQKNTFLRGHYCLQYFPAIMGKIALLWNQQTIQSFPKTLKIG